MTRVDVVVVGAGAVGLAVARALALQGSRVSIVERHAGPGLEQSTHNSQVVHSGLFVRPGSLRAEMCVRGNRMLYDLAPKLGVPVEASGTLVVASAARDLDRLALYREWGGLNGVPGVKTVAPDDVPSIEPRIRRVEGALVAPTGGRVDARAFVTALDTELVRLGVERHYGFGVTKASYADRAWRLSNDAGDVLSSTGVVNAAGVASAAVAALLDAPEYRLYPCLGEYAKIVGSKSGWIRSMVYGFPPAGFPGIGIHLTRTIAGELLVGPSATYLNSAVPESARITALSDFHEEASVLLPDLELADLEFGPVGVRAKPVPPGSEEPFQDFTVREDPPGRRVIQMIGIESPGLTASLSLGEHVASLWRASAAR